MKKDVRTLRPTCVDFAIHSGTLTLKFMAPNREWRIEINDLGWWSYRLTAALIDCRKYLLGQNAMIRESMQRGGGDI